MPFDFVGGQENDSPVADRPESPNFIVSPRGVAFPIPEGAIKVPLINPKGRQTGIAYEVPPESILKQKDIVQVRLMDPVPKRGRCPGYALGYVEFENGLGQAVHPGSKKPLADAENHFEP